MTRFQRNYGLNAGYVSAGESRAFESISASLDGFRETANRMGSQLSQAAANRDAGQIQPSPEAPALKSAATVYGRNYNATVLKGHLAATQNDMQLKIGQVAAEHQRDPKAFADTVNEIRGEYLNGVSPEVRSGAAVSFDAMSNNHLLDIQKRQYTDAINASIMAQKEALDNTRAVALESLTRGNEDQFVQMMGVYEQALAESDLTETEKVQALLGIRREANLAVSMGEIREHLDNGDYRAAIDHINSVRKGNIPMVYADTGLTGEQAADYMQAQFKKFVSDYEAQLTATETERKLADAALLEVHEETVADGYELAAEGNLTLDWVKQHREQLDDQYGWFLERAVEGGTYADVKADPGAYVDLVDRAVAGEDVKADAARALRAGQIEKSWYDQITKQVVDKRFGGADKLIADTLRIDESLGDPFARARNAEAMLQWQQWKQDHPDATRTEALEESRAIVRDTILVGARIDKSVLPKPRNVVMSGSGVDINATRASTVRAFMERLQIPADSPPEHVRQILTSDPDFMRQSELISRWEDVQRRMVEVE